ncbi:MAG: PAS domain S-box protein [Pseudomonadota bacterium]
MDGEAGMKGSEKVRVLYVEDDLGAARLLQKRLVRNGYEVDLAHDGEEGLAKWLGGSYHLLAVDQDMPRKKGLDMIRDLAKLGPLPPTVMVTGHGNEVVAVEAMKLGADDYIMKDGEARYLDLIPSVIERALEKRRVLEDKHLADKKLLESEAQFRLLVESAPEAIFVQTEGCFAYLNPAALRLFGATRSEELLGARVIDQVHPDFRDIGMERIRLLNVEKKEMPPLEQVFLRIDGSPVAVDVSAVPLYYQGQDGALVFVRDITERKRIEEAQMFLLQSGSASSGRDFFQLLARYLAQKLEMDFVCIDGLEGDGLMARTVAVYCDGEFQDNMVYALKDTPCGDVVGKTICCFPRDVSRLFPNDPVLQEMKAECYAGVTLWDHDEKPIGLIAVIGRRPHSNLRHAETILKLVALRAAAELERRRAEKLLAESEERFRSLVESVPGAVYRSEVDVPWRASHISRGVAAITGYEPARFLDDPPVNWADLVYGADWDEVADTVGRAVRDGQVYDMEYRVRHADGSLRWVHERGRCFYGPDDAPAGLEGVIIDVTAKKVAEQELEQSRELLDRIVNSLPVGVVYVDSSKRVQFHNKTHKEWWGVSSEDVRGRTLLEVMGEEHYRGAIEEHVESALRGNRETYEVSVNYRDGVTRHLIADYLPHRGETGEINGFVALITDISAHRRVEDALRASEAKFRCIFEAFPDAVVIARESDGRLMDLNRGFLRVSGYTRAEALSDASSSIDLWIDPDDYRQTVTLLRKHGRVDNRRAKFRRKDGSAFTGLMSAVRVVLLGEPCVLSITRNI